LGDSIEGMSRFVIDTNLFVLALRSADGASRAVLRRCLRILAPADLLKET